MADDRDPRPGAVDAAAAWIEQNRSLYTRDVLWANLRAAGFTEIEIGLAEARLGLALPPSGSGRDLRRRAASILILGTLGVWALAMGFFLVYGSQPERGTYDSASWLIGLGGPVLAAGMLVVLIPSLIAVAVSDRLRRGAEGALVAILAVPFVLVVILAGVCVGPFASR